MLRHQTVDQILQVLRLFRGNAAAGTPLQKAFREAVRQVAQRHGLTYQTIAGACRRRLGLGDVQELYGLLRDWLEGRPEPLLDKVKAAADPARHGEIADLFGASGDIAPAGPLSGFGAGSNDRFATFSFQLPERDARMLRALAEIQGVSPPELLKALVGSAVSERMRRVAEAVLDNAKTPAVSGREDRDILRPIREHEAELRGLGVERLSLFGSAARGDWREDSDVDLAVRLTPDFSKGGFEYFGRIESLRERLEQILGRSVDLIEEPAEAAGLQDRIDEDRVVAF